MSEQAGLAVGSFFEAYKAHVSKKWPDFSDQSLLWLANFGCGCSDLYAWRITAYEAGAEASAAAFRAAIIHNRPAVLFHILRAQRFDLFAESEDSGVSLIFWGLFEAVWRGHFCAASMVAEKMKAFRRDPEEPRGALKPGLGGFFDTWGPHPGWGARERETCGFLWEEPGNYEAKMREIMEEIEAVKPRKKRTSKPRP